MSDNSELVEMVAKLFHEAYEELAPKYGYQTREETRIFDPETPNGKLMLATCEKVITALQEAGALNDPAHDEREAKLVEALESNHLFLMAIRPNGDNRSMDRQIGKEMEKIKAALKEVDDGQV